MHFFSGKISRRGVENELLKYFVIFQNIKDYHLTNDLSIFKILDRKKNVCLD